MGGKKDPPAAAVSQSFRPSVVPLTPLANQKAPTVSVCSSFRLPFIFCIFLAISFFFFTFFLFVPIIELRIVRSIVAIIHHHHLLVVIFPLAFLISAQNQPTNRPTNQPSNHGGDKARYDIQ
jgi:hypothetical protein